MLAEIVRGGWKIVVGVGVVATLTLSVEQSPTLQGLLASLPVGAAVVSAVSPYMTSLALLCLFVVLAIGMSRLGRIEKRLESEYAARDRAFNAWLEQRGAKAEADFEQRFKQLASTTEQRADSIEQAVNRFYQQYDARLANVEMLGVEGPYVEVPHDRWIFLFTGAAFKEYSCWDDEMREQIHKACTWSGNIRFSRQQVRRAVGDLRNHDGKEWDYEHLAAMPEGERLATLKTNLQLWKWYDERVKLRSDGRYRRL